MTRFVTALIAACALVATTPLQAAAQTASLVFGWIELPSSIRFRLGILNVEADQAPNWDEGEGSLEGSEYEL